MMPQENPAYSEQDKARSGADPDAAAARCTTTCPKLFSEGFANAVVDADSPQMKMIEAACRGEPREQRERSRAARAAASDYRAACKRLIVSPDFYEAIQKPNAELVTEPIERIEAAGVRTRDGRLHELDVLVLATGFQVDSFMRPMTVIGRDGATLDEAWAERPNAYLSISIPGFPNLFMLNGPNGPVGNFSLIEVAELQFGYILQLVERLRSGERREISATRRAMDAFEAAARRSREEDHLGHRLPQLVPRRPRHPRDLAVVVRPLPAGDGVAQTGRLRMSYRVVVWGTGNVGRPAMRAVRAHRDLELAGVVVANPAKVGRDAGELAGIGPLGVLATDDAAVALARRRRRGRLRRHAPTPAPPTRSPISLACLRSGRNVVSTAFYPLLHPPSAPPCAARRDRAGLRGRRLRRCSCRASTRAGRSTSCRRS